MPPSSMEDRVEGRLEESAQSLIDSPGGQILSSLRKHLRKRALVLLAFFALGFMMAFPFAGSLISWLVEGSGFVPSGTDVIVLSPIELLALKLRISVYAGLSLTFMLLLVDVLFHGLRHPAVKLRIDEAGMQMPRPGSAFIISFASALLLIVVSQWWTLSVIVPLVLEYLAKDAAASGLDTTWRLSSFIGFILNLCFAGLIAFQTPLVTLLLIRSGAVEREVISSHRRHVWFSAVVLGAILSPPDPLSMILVAAPMLILFELALLFDRILS